MACPACSGQKGGHTYDKSDCQLAKVSEHYGWEKETDNDRKRK